MCIYYKRIYLVFVLLTVICGYTMGQNIASEEERFKRFPELAQSQNKPIILLSAINNLIGKTTKIKYYIDYNSKSYITGQLLEMDHTSDEQMNYLLSELNLNQENSIQVLNVNKSDIIIEIREQSLRNDIFRFYGIEFSYKITLIDSNTTELIAKQILIKQFIFDATDMHEGSLKSKFIFWYWK